MQILDTLNQQNHEITEISNVFLYLIQDRSLCDTEVACRLFSSFGERVQAHLEEVDLLVKHHLLTHSDPWARNLARKLVAQSALLRRNLADYRGCWSKPGRICLHVADQATFLADSQELSDLILDRLQRETEHLYPLLRDTTKGGIQAA